MIPPAAARLPTEAYAGIRAASEIAGERRGNPISRSVAAASDVLGVWQLCERLLL